MGDRQRPNELYRIGHLARVAGVSPDTVRHYERLGALAPALRSSTGYRLYDGEALQRILAIRRGIDLGFSLAELAQAFHIRAQGGIPCRRVRDAAQRRLEQMEVQLRQLFARRTRLKRILRLWDEKIATSSPGTRLGLLEALQFEPSSPQRPTPPPPRRTRRHTA